MKILVVGGLDGQVASALDAVKAQDLEIVVRGPPETDLTNAATLEAALNGVKPDIVICAGAYTAVDAAESNAELAQKVNGDGPAALAKACAAAGVPIIQLSTDYVFSGDKLTPYVETDPTGPTGVYGQTKLSGEQGVIAAGGRYVILRISWVYDPHGRNFVRTMLRLAKSREEIGVVDDQHGRPTYAPDVADALITVARRLVTDKAAPSGVFHMTGQGDVCTWRVFAETIFGLSGARGGPTASVKPISTADYPTPSRRPPNSALDCTKLKAAYGVSLPPWRDSAARCLDIIAAEGWKVG
jgi:dTDP-4-dehydrorhamnose reductase